MQKKDVKIICEDGISLAGTIYQPKQTKAAVMIAPATGIKRHFYNSFATHLAENGLAVLCFDNRGIGGSKGENLNQVNATLINWGKLDMTAAFAQLQSYFPNTTYHIVGHSAGGQLIGLMDNALEVASIFNYGSSSGSIRNMSYPFKLNATFFLNVFVPISNFLFGKTNSQWMGMGEPLPKKVAKQWRKWCNGQGYVATEFGKGVTKHHYDEIKCPSMWLLATDDGISNLANVNDMTRVYANLTSEVVILEPKELDKKAIGHMGFFSKRNKDLWHYATNWLEAHSQN